MKYRYLGNSGLLVSRICLGTMNFGNPDFGHDVAMAKKITNKFISDGGNFIDTADIYGNGVSEEMLGEALKQHDRDSLVVASKCWFRVGKTPNAKGLSRKHIIEACEASLKRMGLDYIDLYQIHGPDPYTPIEETMGTLNDLVTAGKVRYIGCSNLYAWQVVKANAVSEREHWQRFISGQYLYNLLRRDIETEILPACDDQGMGLLCWSPLASGLLTGKYQGQVDPSKGSRIGKRINVDVPRFWNKQSFALVDKTVKSAEILGKTPAQIALSWPLFDRRVTAVVIGPMNVEQTEDNLESGEWDLPENHWKKLSQKPTDHSEYPKEWMDIVFPNNFEGVEFAPRHKQNLP